MFLTLTVGEGTDNIYEYVFDHFSCLNSDLNSLNSPIITCDLYNISSQNTRLVPIVDFNGYSIEPPTQFYSSTESKWKLKVKVPTDTLRNATAGNLIEFYIWSVYNNFPSDAEADGRYAVFSEKMQIAIACGSE